MDSFNLKTASTYINNLLLARGLLRNGAHIEFARPSKGEGGTEATLASIINLVHDMILRRDREQEQREALAQTLRSLRSEATRATLTIERLETRNEELARQISLSQSQERSAKAALRSAEASARTLREEVAKLKGTVQQIRASCANDIRKRDVQIQRLKSHLTDQQRGNKTGLVGASITISPGLNLSKKEDDQKMGNNDLDVNDPAYTLKQETTEFLTQLSQSLSDENDNLIGLVRSTLGTLKELQGLPANAQRAGDTHLERISEEADTDSHMLQVLPTSYDALSKDMEHVLENLKIILTNPNYVPVEEVHRCEDEILRLRQGWEKMESRWREAILLMDGWRTRMVNGGDTINLEEIKMGLGLAEGIPPETRHANTSDPMIDERSDELEGDASLEADESSALQQELDEALDKMQRAKSPNRQPTQSNSPLREADGNSRSPRKVTFETDATTDENVSEVDLLPLDHAPAASKAAPKSIYRFHSPTNPSDRKKAADSTRERSSRKRTHTKVRFTSSVIARTPEADASPIAHDRKTSYSDFDTEIEDEKTPKASRQRIHTNEPSKPQPRMTSPFRPLSPSKFNLSVPLANTNPQPRLPPLTYIYIDPLQSLKRLSSASPLAEERSPKLTVQEKLNVAQAEAEAAAVAAGLKLDDIDVRFEEGFGGGGGMKKDEPKKERDGVKGGSPIKKTGLKGRPKRRKSTLTPEELETLIFK